MDLGRGDGSEIGGRGGGGMRESGEGGAETGK